MPSVNEVFARMMTELRKIPIDELIFTLDTVSRYRNQIPTPMQVNDAAVARALKPKVHNVRGIAEELLATKVSYKGIGDVLVLTALEQAKGNKSAAARLVGMDRKAYERRLRRAKKS